MAWAARGGIRRPDQRHRKARAAARPAFIRSPRLPRAAPRVPRARRHRHQCDEPIHRLDRAAGVASRSLHRRPGRIDAGASRGGPPWRRTGHPPRNPARAPAGAHRYGPHPSARVERPQGRCFRPHRAGRAATTTRPLRDPARVVPHRSLRTRWWGNARRDPCRGDGRNGPGRCKPRAPLACLDVARDHRGRDARLET